MKQYTINKECVICGDKAATVTHLFKKSGTKKMYFVCRDKLRNYGTVRKISENLGLPHVRTYIDIREIDGNNFGIESDVIHRRQKINTELKKLRMENCYSKLLELLYPTCPADPVKRAEAKTKELKAEMAYIRKHDKESLIYEGV